MPHRLSARPLGVPGRLGIWSFSLVLVALLAPSVRAADESLAERIDGLCRQLEAKRLEYHIPGMALCIVKDDEIVLARGFGLRDRGENLPVDENTLFAIGSSTKAFTATMIGMLVDEGKMGWDDPVGKHISYFKLHDDAANEKVTIRDLLCHRTGLTRMGVLWAANQVGRERVLRQVAEAEPLTGFRESFHYNNVMFLAAGVASAHVAGSDWDALLKKRLVDPLGMNRSNSRVSEMLKDKNASKGYLWDEDKEIWEVVPMRELDAIAPAGAINSCASDMAQWLRLLLGRGVYDGKRLVSEAQLEETWETQIPVGGEVSYGLGWMLRQWKDHRVVEHGGNIDGFGATVALLPDAKLGFALLTNVITSPLQQQSLEMVWEALLGDPKPKGTEPVAAAGKKQSPEELERYLGRYHVDILGVDATVQIKDEKLAVDIPGQMVFTLKWPDAKGLWVFDFTPDIQVTFDDKSPDKAAQMTLHQQVKMPCPRKGEATIARDSDAESPAAGKKWNEHQMQPLLGEYNFAAMGVDVTVLVDGDRLAVDIPGQQVYSLLWPDDEERWIIEEASDQSLRFVSGSDGKVTSLVFHRDLVMECARIRAKPDLDVTLDDVFALQGDVADDAKPAKALRFEGTVRFVHQGVSGKFTALVASPTQFRMHLDVAPFGYTITAVDGDRGWIDSNMERSEDAEGAILELMRLSNPFDKYKDWRKSFKETHLMQKDKFNGEEVYVVECVPFEAPIITRYISATSGLVVGEKSAIIAKGLGISIPITETYSDFRDVGGMKIPYHTTTRNDFMGEIIMKVTSVEEDVEIPADAFKKPGV